MRVGPRRTEDGVNCHPRRRITGTTSAQRPDSRLPESEEIRRHIHSCTPPPLIIERPSRTIDGRPCPMRKSPLGLRRGSIAALISECSTWMMAIIRDMGATQAFTVADIHDQNRRTRISCQPIAAHFLFATLTIKKRGLSVSGTSRRVWHPYGRILTGWWVLGAPRRASAAGAGASGRSGLVRAVTARASGSASARRRRPTSRPAKYSSCSSLERIQQVVTATEKLTNQRSAPKRRMAAAPNTCSAARAMRRSPAEVPPAAPVSRTRRSSSSTDPRGRHVAGAPSDRCPQGPHVTPGLGGK